MYNKEHPDLDRFIKPIPEIPGKYTLDLAKIKSYNTDITMITSGRGSSKTHSIVGLECTVDICKHLGDKEMLFLFRSQEEASQALGKNGEGLFSEFWGKIPFLRENFVYRKVNKRIVEFARIKRDENLNILDFSELDWYPAARIISLGSTVRRSVSYEKVAHVIFDEFQIQQRGKRYLKDEYNTFINLMSTVMRDRKVKVWLMANPGSIINPYYSGLGYTNPDQEVFTKSVNMTNPDTGEVTRVRLGIFELKIDPDKLKTANVAGAFGNHSDFAGTYGIVNRFIDKRNASSRIDSNFIIDDHNYSLYRHRLDDGQVVLLVCKGHNPGARYTLSDSFITGQSMKNNLFGYKLRDAAMDQRLYFDSLETRESLVDFINSAY